MRRFSTLGVLLLALLWLPATVHCQLELLSGLKALSCCSHAEAENYPDHHDHDCNNDGCATIESGFYKPQDAESSFRPTLLGSLVVMGPLSNGLCPVRASFRTGPPTAPPDIHRVWQFLQRTALPARAPDRAS